MPSSFSLISSLSVIDYMYILYMYIKKYIPHQFPLSFFFYLYESLRDGKYICSYSRYDVHNTNHNGMRIRSSDILYLL